MSSSLSTRPRSLRARYVVPAMLATLSTFGIVAAQPASAMSISAYAKTTSYPYSHSSGTDPLRYYERQCVSYAAWWLLHHNHKEVYFAGSAGAWKSWAIKHHYKVNHTAAVGVVAWWSRGHVAIVEYVGTHYIRVREFNWTHSRAFDERWIKRGSSGWPQYFLYIK